MDKSLRSSLLIIILIFLVSFGLVLVSVILAGAFSFKVTLFLFLATLISSLLAVTILGGYFTALSSHLIHLRRLFRLDNLSHPLLLRLSTEAPGTFHHSILVANLSSKAAKAISADSLLCRVSAYFHDLGKLKEPGFYIENQNMRNQNINEQTTTPLKSARKIIEHSKEGIRLAQEAHLPAEVVNLIAQHHGTSLCGYFWQLAKEKNPTRVKRSDFRYPGPKPQTKEAAILMLADSLEAKVRAEGSLLDLGKLVEETFKEKIEDKQLEDARLTPREIFRLKRAFTEALESMLHPRIEYPLK